MSTADIARSPAHVSDARWDVVQRVSTSASFQRSPRLRELLLYICERAILNRPEELREQQIGCGVFGRRPDYSPGEDNIVRVEVRHLRKRLEEYFLGEGKDEPVVIVVPKGAYVPSFEPREVVYPPPAQEPEVAAAAVTTPEQTANQTATIVPPRRWASLQPALILALTVLCVFLWQQNRLAGAHPTIAATQEASASTLWPLLFNQSHQTYIVCADSTLVVAQLLLHHRVTLQQYLASDDSGFLRSLSPPAADMMRRLPRWQFTDMADLRLVQRLSQVNSGEWENVTIRSARNTQIQDFKNASVVMLGSNRSNPWNELFEPMLNFVFDFDEQAQAPLVRNKKPQPGEEPEYRAGGPGVSGTAYSTIALVPNLRRTGNVIIIAGTTGEATEATGEFLTDSKAAIEFSAMLTHRNKGHLPYFEALLRSTTLAGAAKDPEVVALRVLPGDPTQLLQ